MLKDSYGRIIDYLRISVTDRCNLRCVYCMPQEGIMHKPHKDLLTFEELIKIVEASVSLGINKIRLTGGEPLVRKDITDLVKSLSRIKEIEDISMTTNGILLKEYVLGLKRAGLKRINISLDSLNKTRYKFISRGGNLEDILAGIRLALKVGFSPLKINVLLLDGIENEVSDFLRLTLENPLHIRFLEFMPINTFYKREDCIPASLVMDIAQKISPIEETKILGFGPAKVYRFKNALGSFGIITPLSDKFCFNCNRLRLTSDGLLKVCLHSDLKIDLRNPLRNGADKEELIRLINLAVELKPKEHALDKEPSLFSEYSMCQIGG